MFKKHHLLIVSLLLSSLSFSQGPKQENFSKQYNDYFKKESENIFTQLNKTNYTRNESLWFTSYVYYNNALKPYLSTTNIYINIYNSFGLMIDQKVFKCTDGYMQGQLKIDEKYKPGIYYIKTTTNWMRNFDTDLSDLKQFVVDSEIKNKSPKEKYDFDIIPESGTLVNNIINTIGVRLNSKLNTSNLKGVVTDNDNNVITVFKFNEFGIGKFSAMLTNNNQYQVCVYDSEDKKKSKTINHIKDTGLHLNLINKPQSVIIKLVTNKNTLKNLVQNEYNLYIHRDGNINNIPIVFENNKTSYSYLIKKTDLHKGITIFSLLNNQNKAVLERLYFNDLDHRIGGLEVLTLNKGKDSTTVTLKTTINSTKKNYFSVSVVPENSDLSGLKENIKTKLLLFPYLNEPTQNIKQYLTDTSRESLYNLDLLLLTQGKSKQSLVNILNTKTTVRYNFDTGFKIKGKLNTTEYKKGNYIELISSNNALKAKSDISTENEFVFDNLYIGSDTEINFLLRNKRGRALKVKPYYNFFPQPFVESIPITKIKSSIKKVEPIKHIKNFILNDDVVELDEVALGNIKKEKEETDKPIGSGLARHITFEDEPNTFRLITDVIREGGFDVFNDGFKVSIISRRFKSLKSRNGLTPAVFVNNISINNDLSQLATMVVNDVEDIYISNHGSIYGSMGVGGAINIYLKKGKSLKAKNKHRTFNTTFGFEDSLDYKSPRYSSTASDFFSKYGVLNWISSTMADENGIITIKFPNYLKEKVRISVNGMDENGTLYSLDKMLSLD